MRKIHAKKSNVIATNPNLVEDCPAVGLDGTSSFSTKSDPVDIYRTDKPVVRDDWSFNWVIGGVSCTLCPQRCDDTIILITEHSVKYLQNIKESDFRVVEAAMTIDPRVQGADATEADKDSGPVEPKNFIDWDERCASQICNDLIDSMRNNGLSVGPDGRIKAWKHFQLELTQQEPQAKSQEPPVKGQQRLF